MCALYALLTIDFSSVAIGLNINILEEKIPHSYDQLRIRIEELAQNARDRDNPPVLKKSNFW